MKKNNSMKNYNNKTFNFEKIKTNGAKLINNKNQ